MQYVSLIRNMSQKYQAFCDLNEAFRERFQSVRESSVYLGAVSVYDSKEAKGIDRLEILKRLACHDPGQLEYAMDWLEHDYPIILDYYQAFQELQDTIWTPELEIPEDCAYTRFYTEEAEYIDYGSLLGPKFDLSKTFLLCVRWDAYSEYRREHPGIYFMSMNPPLGTECHYYSAEELTAAYQYGVGHRKIHWITKEQERDTLKGQPDACPLCGRPVAECGSLSALDLKMLEPVPMGEPYLGDLDFGHSSVLIPACMNCTTLWYRYLRDIGNNWDKRGKIPFKNVPELVRYAVDVIRQPKEKQEKRRESILATWDEFRQGNTWHVRPDYRMDASQYR